MKEYTQWNERLHRLFLLPGTFGDAQSALGISERAQAILLHQKSKLRESRGPLLGYVRIMQ
jgi:hypothetical protein